MLDGVDLILRRMLRLPEVARINPRLEKKLMPDEVVAFVPMSGLSGETAEVTGEESRVYSQVSKGYTAFQNDDLLMAKITPCFENNKIAHAKLSRQYAFGSTEFHVIRPNPEVVDTRYLLHFLRQDQIRLEGQHMMTGSAGQRRVPEHFLENLRVFIPSLSEQRHIASILDQVEVLRNKRRVALSKTNELIISLFVQIFGDLESSSANWPIHPISDYVVSFQGGKSIEADGDNFLSRNRILKVSAVTGSFYRPNESKPLPDSYEPPKEHFVRPDDLLFSRANTTKLVGAVAYVYTTPANLLLPDKLWRFIWREPKLVDPLFVWTMFQMKAVRDAVSRRATGTSGSMKNISQEKLLAMPTILPSLAMQQGFADRLRALLKIKLQQLASAEKLVTLFASLQHRAFRGEL